MHDDGASCTSLLVLFVLALAPFVLWRAALSTPARAVPQPPETPLPSVDVMADEDGAVFCSFSVIVGLLCFRRLAKPALPVV